MIDTSALSMLARKLGVLTEYLDSRGTTQRPGPDALIAVLRSLGVDISAPDDAEDLLRSHALNDAMVQPVVIAWDGASAAVEIAAAERLGPIEVSLVLEDGTTIDQLSSPVACAPGLHLLNTPDDLATGYHTLHVRAGSRRGQSLIVSAPRKAYTDPGRRWIGFLPLYSLHSERNPEIADFTDLGDLGEWLKEVGNGMVGTLPLLAAFLEPPLFEPSPYTPVSRLAWNELYLDVKRSSAEAEPEQGRIVDYQRIYAQKRPLIAAAAARAFNDPETKEAIVRFVGAHPHVFHYARYRAATALAGEPWREPESRMVHLYGEAFDDALRFHQYAQWQADAQMAGLRKRSSGLYLDYPIGVHGLGFDTWRYPNQFVMGVSAGAPPDDYFDGQNWSFPPLHPNHIHDDAFAYLRQTVAHHMRHASVLRFDHILGLHRMYFIPDGFDANAGTYVEYPADQLYAVLSIESHRNKTVVIGEDLGTVPPYVPRTMAKHDIGGIFVDIFSFSPSMNKLPVPANRSLASLDTHDTPPFARWWRGADIDDRVELGMLDPEQGETERRQRDAVTARVRTVAGVDNSRDAHRTLTDSIAASPASFVLINLEDLWMEEEPQNIPGTSRERPNWRRRSALSLEQMRDDPTVQAALRRVTKLRKEATP